MHRRIVVVLLLLTAYLPNTLCGCKNSTEPVSRADTPMNTLENMAEALEAGDISAFKACFIASEKQAEMLEAI